MTDIEEVTKTLLEFRNERDWEQFHNSKDEPVYSAGGQRLGVRVSVN